MKGFFDSVPAYTPAQGSYGYNFEGTIDDAEDDDDGHGLIHFPRNEWIPIRDTRVLAPSDMIAWGDALIATWDYFHNGPIGVPELSGFDPTIPYYKAVMDGVPSGDVGVQTMKKRHGGLWAVGFCDAHVETLRPPKLFLFQDDTIARRWNRDHQPHNTLE
jgi:hypothetical protein